MATSRSPDPQAAGLAGAQVFSGRPDPTWPVDQATAGSLQDLWSRLEPWEGEIPAPPPLGYRGCFLRLADGREWQTYGGVVTLRQAGAVEFRRDRARAFEKQLLGTAPEGTLPHPA